MAAKLKDTKHKQYMLSYKQGEDTFSFAVAAGYKLTKRLQHSIITTGSVTAKTGDKFYAVFEFQKDKAISIWTLQETCVKKVKFPEAIEKFKIDSDIHKAYEDLYVADPHDTATGQQWFIKGHGCFVNHNTL